MYLHSHDHSRFRRCGPTSGGLFCCSCFSRSSSALKVRSSSTEADSHRLSLRRGIGVCPRSAPMRRAGWVFTHGSHLDRGARAAGGSNSVRRWQSGWREVCCRTRVQTQVGEKMTWWKEVKAQRSFRGLQLQFRTAEVSRVSKNQTCQSHQTLMTDADHRRNRKKSDFCFVCCGGGKKNGNNAPW